MKYRQVEFRAILKSFNHDNNLEYDFNAHLYCIILHIPLVKSVNSYNLWMYVTYKLKRGGVINRLGIKAFLNDYTSEKYADCNLKPSEFNNYVFNSSALNKLTLDIYDEKHIKRAYLNTNYAMGGGTLGSSCMRHKDMQKSLNFYERACCKIIILQDSHNKIYGRALLWENVRVNGKKDTIFYMDRIYTVSSKYNHRFYDMAETNKWKFCDSQSFAGCRTNDMYIININLKGITHLPYADSFKYLWFNEEGGGILTAGCQPPEIKNPGFSTALLHVQDRGYCRALDPDSVQEKFSGFWVSKKDCTFIKKYGGFVYKGNIIKLQGIFYSKYDKAITESRLDGMILKTDLVLEAITVQSMNKNKGTKLKIYKDKYVHKKHLVTVKGHKYHKEDTNVVNFEKKWFAIRDCRRDPDGKLIPKERCLSFFALHEGSKYYTNKIKTIHEKSKINDLKYLAKRDKGKILYIAEFRLDTFRGYVIMNTGEYIVDNEESRSFIKKYNKTYYLKTEYPIEPPKYWYPNNKKKVLITKRTLFDEMEVETNASSK